MQVCVLCVLVAGAIAGVVLLMLLLMMGVPALCLTVAAAGQVPSWQHCYHTQGRSCPGRVPSLATEGPASKVSEWEGMAGWGAAGL